MIPKPPTPAEIRDRRAKALVEDFARNDPSGRDLAELRDWALRDAPEWWRKQLAGANPLTSRELAGRIYDRMVTR